MDHQPDIRSSFEYGGNTIGLEWFDIESKAALEGIMWQQVYVIGSCDGLVPIVHYESGKDNLPGGHVEPGETVEVAMHREIQEELNMKVLDWQPIGYQKLTEPDGSIVFQLRVYATLEPLSDFSEDPGGSVSGHSLISINELNDHIAYGEVGERMIRRVQQLI